ncbi:MAG TPA: hypothetical protein VM165_17275 [Planctomycetaceae bacterium]|nr:hypothetical protein [Planctomycetaceae bacterium]
MTPAFIADAQLQDSQALSAQEKIWAAARRSLDARRGDVAGSPRHGE